MLVEYIEIKSENYSDYYRSSANFYRETLASLLLPSISKGKATPTEGLGVGSEFGLKYIHIITRSRRDYSEY
jgi:hypothetical protein